MLQAMEAGRSAVSEGLLVSAFAQGSIGAAEQAVAPAIDEMVETFRPRMRDALLETLTDGGRAAAAQLNRRLGLRGAATQTPTRTPSTRRTSPGNIQIVFDGRNQRAVEWAEQRSASMVVEISGRTRQAIQRTIRNSFNQGRPPREAARQLRSFVGLTRAHMSAVSNLDLKLRGSAGKIVYAGSMRIRVPEEGASTEFIDKWTKRYSERLLKYRTENIARTETIAASNEGQRQLWQQSIAAGWLPQNARRTWITTDDDRLCPVCEDMDGQVVLVAENFETPEGESVSGPPAHPSCRCAQGITDEPVNKGDD